MFRLRARILDWLLIPILFVVADLAAFGQLVLPAFPFWAHVQLGGEARAYHYPILCFISDALRAGHLPLWNPYQEGGFPLYCDPRSQLWFPVTWLIALTAGYSFRVVQYQLWATFAVAGCGGYAFGRALGLRRAPAFSLGAGYMASGIFVGGGSDLAATTAMALFPFALALSHVALLGGRWRPAVGAGLVLALAGLGGRPSILAASLFNLAAYSVLLKAILGPRLATLGRRRLAVLTAIPIVVCLGVTAIQWLPPLVRAPELAGGRLPRVAAEIGRSEFADFATHLVPGLDAASPEAGSRSLWISLSLLLAALLAWTRRGAAAQATALLCLYGVNMLLALGGSLFALAALRAVAPPFDFFSHPAAGFRGFSLLSLASLGAVGFDNLLRLPSHRLRVWLRPVLIGAMGAGAAALTCLALMTAWAAARGFGGAEWQALNDLWLSVLLALGGAAILLLIGTRRFPVRLAASLFAAWVVVEASAQTWRAAPTMAEPLTPANAVEEAQLEAFRTMGFPASLAAERVPGSHESRDANTPWIEKTPAARSRVTARLARYTLLAQLASDTPGMDQLFSIGEAGSRVALVSGFELAGSPDDAFARLAARVEGRANSPVVEAPPDLAYDWQAKMAAPAVPGLPNRRSGRIDAYEPGRAELQVESPVSALVVFTDAVFPDWRASLDGAPVRIWTANGLFRAVFVPPGPHRLTFVLRPWPVAWGAGVSLAFLLAAIAALVAPPRRNFLKFTLPLPDSSAKGRV